MEHELWAMNHEPWTMNLELWTINHEPWTMNHEPWTMNHEPWTMNREPWTQHYHELRVAGEWNFSDVGQPAFLRDPPMEHMWAVGRLAVLAQPDIIVFTFSPSHFRPHNGFQLPFTSAKTFPNGSRPLICLPAEACHLAIESWARAEAGLGGGGIKVQLTIIWRGPRGEIEKTLLYL
jgi:hypothetical protein